MTKDKAIAELIRIWHSPHLDLSLKAGLAEAIDALKGEDGDLISRADAIDACCRGWNNTAEDCIRNIKALPSAESKTTCIAQIKIDRDDIEDMVNEKVNEIVDKMAEPKTGKWKLDPNGMDWNIPAWRCSECGFVATHIGVEPNGLGDSPLNWAGSKFCPQCGARITGYER